MKDLKDWGKQLKHFSLISLIFTTSLYAVNSDNNYLSQTKQDILNYSYEKAEQDSKKLKNDWISPITYTYTNNKSDTSSNDGDGTYRNSNSNIKISQPIFKSGGIYSAIKYANSYEQYANTDIDTQRKELITQVINILYEIKQTSITIEKQKLLVKNAEIDIQRKKELVLNGLSDSSFLDNAIIEANTRKNTLVDLEYQKIELVNTLSTLSDKKYEELELPVFTILDDDKFLDNNIYLRKASEDIETAYWTKNMIISSYLPTVNFTTDYTKYHSSDDNSLEDNTRVGFNITIPLDIRVSNDIQSNKIAYLQKKLVLTDTKKEESSLYKSSMAKVTNIEKKIIIAQNNVKLYDSLLTQLEEQLSVGMSTPSDVETMENSKKINSLEVKSLAIDIQLKLLEIYSRIES